MEPVFNCFGCGCIPQSVKSSEKPLGPVSLDAAPCACTLLHTRFSRLLPVTLQLQSTFQPSPRSGLLSDRLDRSKDQSQAERQKWTTRKQLAIKEAKDAEMRMESLGTDIAKCVEEMQAQTHFMSKIGPVMAVNPEEKKRMETILAGLRESLRSLQRKMSKARQEYAKSKEFIVTANENLRQMRRSIPATWSELPARVSGEQSNKRNSDQGSKQNLFDSKRNSFHSDDGSKRNLSDSKRNSLNSEDGFKRSLSGGDAKYNTK